MIGERIRERREAEGMTQETLSREAGISLRGIQFIEAGARQPRIDTLLKIADVLEVSYTTLIEDQ